MLKQLHGKDFIIKLDGKVRKVGEISGANIDRDRTQLEITIDLTDEEVAGIFGAAADKAEAAASPIGMTDAKIENMISEGSPA